VRYALPSWLTHDPLSPPGLNAPSSYYRSIRPVEMISALSHPEPGRRVPLFSSREHQDAQELFQLVSEYIKKEATAVDREGARDLGLGALASLSSSPSTAVDVSKGVFDGLTANRRSCCECGYTEAVMHFPFDNWQLTVPRVVRPFPLSPAFSF
jgi:ubiquitin carboxyl-terminal hydrolase 1